VALDKESIEKQDFPMARRGYDPEAVDAHLSAVAEEFEQLSRSVRRGGGTLAGAASDQVRAIVEAAEATAAQVRSEAEEDARRIRSEARNDAKAAQASAAARAGERVSQVSESASAMLERIEAIDRELSALLDELRAGATRVGAELSHLQESLQDTTAVGAVAVAGSEPEPAAPEPRAPEPEPPAPDPAPPEPEPAPGRARATAKPAGASTTTGPGSVRDKPSDHEGARLIALNMALNGSPRDEIDRYLSEHYELQDRGALLDEVFASVEG
jgi:DivIVA domain-containing protein